MHVTVISPESSVYDGPADAIVAPAYDGRVGILPHHAPFMTLLGTGPLVVRNVGTTHTFMLSGGFLQVIGDTVRIVTEHAEATDSAGTKNHSS